MLGEKSFDCNSPLPIVGHLPQLKPLTNMMAMAKFTQIAAGPRQLERSRSKMFYSLSI